MLHHCRAVARGCKNSFMVGDLPYGSYETSPEDALRTAVRFVKEGNVEAVKLEGGKEMAETIRRITAAGIPVMGHIGLTPQRQAALGGYKVQGKTAGKVRCFNKLEVGRGRVEMGLRSWSNELKAIRMVRYG